MMRVPVFFFVFFFVVVFFFPREFSISISWVCIKLKYGSHAIYVHKIRYDTAVCIYCGSFQYFSFGFRKRKKKKKKKKKKPLPKLECVDKKLPKKAVFEILENPFLQNCY